MSESETVQRCCNAYYTVYAEEMAKGMNRRLERARVAYLQHVPFLCGPENIRAFIACIAHAMLLRIIQLDEGSKLLYAAQTARSALPREVRPVGRPRNSAYPHPEPAEAQPQPAQAQPQPTEKASAPQPEKNTPTPSPSRPASVQTAASAGRSKACPDPAKAFIELAEQEAISAPPPQPEKNTATPSPAHPVTAQTAPFSAIAAPAPSPAPRPEPAGASPRTDIALKGHGFIRAEMTTQ